MIKYHRDICAIDKYNLFAINNKFALLIPMINVIISSSTCMIYVVTRKFMRVFECNQKTNCVFKMLLSYIYFYKSDISKNN